jgi:NADH-quinone oxidoreductase subunit J
VIMLLGVDNADDIETEPLVGQRPAAIAIGVLLAAGLVAVVVTSTVTGVPSASAEWVRDGDDIAQIGRLLFTEYLFAFEITSLLLVIAVVGAVLLARTRAGDQVDDDEAVPVLPGEVLLDDEADEEADA